MGMNADLVGRFLTAGLKGKIDFEMGRRAIEKLGHQSLEEWPPDLLEQEGFTPREGLLPKDVKPGGLVEKAARGVLLMRLTADLYMLRDAVEEASRDGTAEDISSTDLEEALDELRLAGVTEAMGFAW